MSTNVSRPASAAKRRRSCDWRRAASLASPSALARFWSVMSSVTPASIRDSRLAPPVSQRGQPAQSAAGRGDPVHGLELANAVVDRLADRPGGRGLIFGMDGAHQSLNLSGKLEAARPCRTQASGDQTSSSSPMFHRHAAALAACNPSRRNASASSRSRTSRPAARADRAAASRAHPDNAATQTARTRRPGTRRRARASAWRGTRGRPSPRRSRSAGARPEPRRPDILEDDGIAASQRLAIRARREFSVAVARLRQAALRHDPECVGPTIDDLDLGRVGVANGDRRVDHVQQGFHRVLIARRQIGVPISGSNDHKLNGNPGFAKAIALTAYRNQRRAPGRRALGDRAARSAIKRRRRTGGQRRRAKYNDPPVVSLSGFPRIARQISILYRLRQVVRGVGA